MFCNVNKKRVITAVDANNIYEVPSLYYKEGLDKEILNFFNIKKISKKSNLNIWNKVVKRFNNPNSEVTIAIVGKYTNLKDSYKSLVEALHHGGIANKTKVNIKWINARENENISFEEIQGIIIPGGFGITGIENILPVIELSRKNKIPTFGICLGMQLMIIEFFRNVLGYKDAGSEEFNSSKNIKICNYT